MMPSDYGNGLWYKKNGMRGGGEGGESRGEVWPCPYYSVEHEISYAHKDIDIKKFGFLGSDKPRMLFLLLLNVKMPTILTFMSWKNFMLD